MKKLMAIFLVTSLLLGGCNSAKDEPAAPSENTNQPTQEADEGEPGDNDDANDQPSIGQIEVDKNLLDVSINIPAAVYEGTDPDDVIANADERGMKAELEADGSYTITMSKAKHNELMADLVVSIDASFDDIINGDDFASVVGIERDNSFEEISMIVDKDAFENSFDAFAVLGIVMQVQTYNIMNGTPDNKITVHLVDAATSEIYNTAVYPDAWDE